MKILSPEDYLKTLKRNNWCQKWDLAIISHNKINKNGNATKRPESDSSQEGT